MSGMQSMTREDEEEEEEVVLVGRRSEEKKAPHPLFLKGKS